jgi:zinc D-Ala-D-Ala carboxypeptidase
MVHQQTQNGAAEVITDWSVYPNFRKEEFDCKHTGQNDMRPDFMARLQALRSAAGFPFFVTSGYRSALHPVEARKQRPGMHAKGCAVDITCDAAGAYRLVSLALQHGFTGIGISQKDGLARFVHLDTRDSTPVIYSY